MVDVTRGADDHDVAFDLPFERQGPASPRAPGRPLKRRGMAAPPMACYFTVVSASSSIHVLYGTKLTRLLTAYSFEGAYRNTTLAWSWM